MNLVKKILTKLNGLHYPQDYLCFAAEDFAQPLRVFLVEDGRIKKDITALHAFVGYCPVIFALPFLSRINEKERIEVAFAHGVENTNEPLQPHQLVAKLSFRKIHCRQIENNTVSYYEAVKGGHGFTNVFNQATAQLHNRLYNQKQGNVFLKGNLFKQVQIAYSLPRKICLITVGTKEGFNVFPTDLHGAIDGQHYVISLRHAGHACKQVTTAQTILLSEMQSSAYRNVYGLGKNHTQPLKEFSAFPFSENRSALLGLPLPNDVVRYKELQLQDSFDAGIHKLLLFKIVGQAEMTHKPQTLVHVHNAYASWRRKQGLSSNYLLR